MEHVVFFTSPDGVPSFARFASMSDAVAFVERLRNVDGVADAALFALTPVPMVVTTYYRVEVPPLGAASDSGSGPEVASEFTAAVESVPQVAANGAVLETGAVPVVETSAPAVDVPAPAAPEGEVADAAAAHAAEPAPEPAVAPAAEPAAEPAASGKSRSLGFFAH